MGKDKQSVDPNNSAWAKDKSRFGFQMLLKMGWKEGQGLGAKEDGITKHIKVKQREEGTGLGANDDAEGFMPWTVHKKSFDQILSKLQARTGSDDEDSSSDEPITPMTPAGTKRTRSVADDAKRVKKKAKKAEKKALQKELAETGLSPEELQAKLQEAKAARKAARAQKREARKSPVPS